jgi:NADH-quinone oxidoreductase subunit E
MAALSDNVMQEIRALPPQFPDVRTAVMPALDLAQEEVGYLTPETMSEVAAALNLDPGYVEGVATFYTLFHTAPVGKHRLYLCTNISCKLRGADELLAHTMKAVGVEDSDAVSADGLFSVEAVECLGACEYAPVMRLDHAYHHDLTPEKIDRLIAERRGQRDQPLPPPGDQLLPARGEVAAKPPEGTPRKPRTTRKKKADG